VPVVESSAAAGWPRSATVGRGTASRTMLGREVAFMKFGVMGRTLVSGGGPITTAGMPSLPRIRNARRAPRRQYAARGPWETSCDLPPSSESHDCEVDPLGASASALCRHDSRVDFASPRSGRRLVRMHRTTCDRVDRANLTVRDPKSWDGDSRRAHGRDHQSVRASRRRRLRGTSVRLQDLPAFGLAERERAEREASTARDEPRQPEHGPKARARCSVSTCS